ncbi:MAG: hypothetical protein SGJ19_05435 [Planctomycetia bacterium]|nr:hypothetical protein [Planctomycetia bacterium]
MPESVLEAIKQGVWDFEPRHVDVKEFPSTVALPGSSEKIDILADRVRRGLPLWHGADRLHFEDVE